MYYWYYYPSTAPVSLNSEEKKSFEEKYMIRPEYKRKELQAEIEALDSQIEQITLLLTEKSKLREDKKKELEDIKD